MSLAFSGVAARMSPKIEWALLSSRMRGALLRSNGSIAIALFGQQKMVVRTADDLSARMHEARDRISNSCSNICNGPV